MEVGSEMKTDAWTVFRAWVFLSELTAWALAVVLAIRGRLLWAAGITAYALAADTTGRLWSHRTPVAMPYFMRWVLLVPRGPHSPQRLERVLQPRGGEPMLEIGPGVGVHAL